MSAWILPDHIADVLPSEARHIEELRRGLLDTARGYGYELVIPPMLEHLDSLLTGAGESLNLQTYKLVDQLSGRTVGLRADTTQQVARIDAHLLNRPGVVRLCYCGPVLHTLPDKPHATREPLQFGAEVYGHAGLEADVEVLTLAIECLHQAGVSDMTVDLADIRIVRGLLAGLTIDSALQHDLHMALARKDVAHIAHLSIGFPQIVRDGLLALTELYGGIRVLDEAAHVLCAFPGVAESLDELRQLASAFSGANITFDLADLRGYSYYSGVRFSIFVPGAADAVARGGRYDEVGAAYGRNRPAAGFSLDIKQVVSVAPTPDLKKAIRAPWGKGLSVNDAVWALRQQGEIVVCVLPGHDGEVDEFNFDRELVHVDGRWVVRAI